MTMFEKFSTQNELLILLGVTTIFGAIVHATSQLKIKRDQKQEFTFADFVILTVIAMFSGMVFGLLATLIWSNITIIILSTAIGAFLGMAGLNKVANIVLELVINSASKK